MSFGPGIPVEFCREKMLEAAIAAAKRILEAIFCTESNLRGRRTSMIFFKNHLYINGLLAHMFTNYQGFYY